MEGERVAVSEATACVYALRHRAKGLMYIGSSRRLAARLKVWKARLSCVELDIHPEWMSERFYKVARGLSASDWDVVVIERFDASVDRETLRSAEYRYVDCLRRLWPGSVLNVVVDLEADRDWRLLRESTRYVRGFRTRLGEVRGGYDGRNRR